MAKILFKLYNRLCLCHPRLTLALLAVLFSLLAYEAKNFHLDASTDSLILEQDQDLRLARETAERYKTAPFLLITFKPHGDLFADDSLKTLQQFQQDLSKVKGVTSIVSLLNVPLFSCPPVPLKNISENIKHLQDPQVNRKQAKQELLNSPLFRNLLISANGKIAALKVNLERFPEYEQRVAQRTKLANRRLQGGLTAPEQKQLQALRQQCAKWLNQINQHRHRQIRDIRAIMSRYQARVDILMGGVPMVSDDLVTFVKKDLMTFGISIFLFLVAMMWLLFRRWQWILIPMGCCFLSSIFMIGLLGLFGWDVTVISSNFISLQLVITMSLSIHLVVRYNEILTQHPELDKKALVRETVRTIFIPCLYATLTTIAGFSSLMFCNILPVINFGWMMTVGLVVSLLVSFLFFPAATLVLPSVQVRDEAAISRPVTAFCARITRKYRPFIFLITAISAITITWGILHIRVENSFIDYFRKTTEIYRGMREIDRNMGGTTPLDVLISFAPTPTNKPSPAPPAATDEGDDFDEFDEFNDVADSANDAGTYWYTRSKMELLERVHKYLDQLPESGKVLSLATIDQLATKLNNGTPLDSIGLAVLFKDLPDDFKKALVNPYVSIADNQARINLRIKDSLPGLRRNELLKRIHSDLKNKLGLKESQFQITGLMVLYNNMLQSLFRSQIKTIGFTVLALTLTFLLLFRSLLLALIAIFPNFLASAVVLGVMGIANIPLDMMTITIVAICIGIAVDDTIHYIHRFRHELAKDGDYLTTMERTHASIGAAIYYTSVTIIVGFSVLALSNFIPSILFGLLTGLAMAAALIGTLTLLPSLLILLKPFPQTSVREDGAEEKR